MKKKIVLFLAIAMAFVLCACSAVEPENETAPIVEAETALEPAPTEDAVEEEAMSEPLMEETVIVDTEECTFTIKSIDENGAWGYTLHVLCENKTDKTLMFAWDGVSVNGYMLDPFWAQEVAAGKKSNSEISFYTDSLKGCGISSVDEIEFNLTIYDSEDWNAERIVNDTFSVYPTGLDAASVCYPDRAKENNEYICCENDQAVFVILGTEPDGDWGYTVNCYAENKTDATLSFSWDSVSVNGFMIDPFWGTEVAAGKRAYCEISFFDEDFETNGIENVDEIEFCLRVHDANDWDADPIVEDVFTYNP